MNTNVNIYAHTSIYTYIYTHTYIYIHMNKSITFLLIALFDYFHSVVVRNSSEHIVTISVHILLHLFIPLLNNPSCFITTKIVTSTFRNASSVVSIVNVSCYILILVRCFKSITLVVLYCWSSLLLRCLVSVTF